ncbi:hypothetical protein CTI14_72555, partial [Methylobacterium radiotolerans]
TFAKLGQYSTTSIPTFVQHACIAALEEGDGFIRTTFAKLGQYSTTSIPTFVQHACIAALEEGDGFI